MPGVALLCGPRGEIEAAWPRGGGFEGLFPVGSSLLAALHRASLPAGLRLLAALLERGEARGWLLLEPRQPAFLAGRALEGGQLLVVIAPSPAALAEQPSAPLPHPGAAEALARLAARAPPPPGKDRLAALDRRPPEDLALLLGGFLHDVRNLATSGILGCEELGWFLAGHPDPDAAGALAQHRGSLQRLPSLARSFEEALYGPRSPAARPRLDARALLEEVLQGCAEDAAARQVSVRLSREGSGSVSADPGRLKEGLEALLRHAIGACSPGSQLSLASAPGPAGWLLTLAHPREEGADRQIDARRPDLWTARRRLDACGALLWTEDAGEERCFYAWLPGEAGAAGAG